MTDHPITPPPELVSEWARNRGYLCSSELWDYIATKAARWGADTELEACCSEVSWNGNKALAAELRTRRRPKPPSLKAQALDAWDRLRNEAWCEEIDFDLDFVRRALEALDD